MVLIITQYFNTGANIAYNCECDKFKQLWRRKSINDNNVMYTFSKYSPVKERYTETLKPEFINTHYSSLQHEHCLLTTEET